MKKGFTLVELIACVVLLAVILGFVTPNIVSTMNNNKKDTFYTSAKAILRQIEYDDLIKNNETFNLSELDISGLSHEDYDLENSYVKMVDDVTYLYLKGIGKFNNMNICGITSSTTTINVTSENCEIN